MLKSYRLNANYNFGNDVKNSIYVDSLMWTETESVEKEILQKFLYECLSINCAQKVYFFTTMRLNYPLDWRIKRIGLWKTYALKFGLIIDSSIEHFIENNRHTVISGCCYAQCTIELIELLVKNSFHSWILVSERQYEFEELNEVLKNKGDNKILSYEFIINNFCHRNDKVVIMIDGSGESSFNIFYEKIEK